MSHRLAALHPGVDDQAVALSVDPAFPDERQRACKEVGKLRRGSVVLHELPDVGGVSAGDDEGMEGGLGHDIGDDQGLLSLPEGGGRDLPPEDEWQRTNASAK